MSLQEKSIIFRVSDHDITATINVTFISVTDITTLFVESRKWGQELD